MGRITRSRAKHGFNKIRTVSTSVRTSAVIFLEWRFGLWRHHLGLARLQRLASAALRCLRRIRCPDFRRRRDSVPPGRENGRSHPWCGFLVFTLLCVPGIVAAPQIYNSWGNFFEQFSLLTGAAIVYARLSSAWSRADANRIGRILLGICAASFTLEQAFYLHATAKLVPQWIPPSQMFWAVATTVLFALAAVALLTNRMALLATRLLTIMLVSFGLFVWVPLILSNPHNHTNWSEIIETFEIAGAAWILADLLGESQLSEDSPR